MPHFKPSAPASLRLAALLAAFILEIVMTSARAADRGRYPDLLELFAEWRATEAPALVEGAPDYTPDGVAVRHARVKALQARLADIDPQDWSVPQQVDYHIVRAEMNGFDFNVRVLRPWARDPAFYQQVWSYESDTPAHEGPTNHALIELWTYEFPLSSGEAERLKGELRTVPALLRQARGNLTGDARDLWIAGVKTMEDQEKDLLALGERVGDADADLSAAIEAAAAATGSFVRWLKDEAPGKTGPSGVGREHYTWMLQNVHLVPLTWEDEVMLLKRELKRAHAALRLEEHRNRGLPEIEPVNSPEAYRARALAGVRRYVEFLVSHEVLQDAPFLIPALDERIGEYAPPETRNFFAEASHREPMTLWAHFYHWWDLARIKTLPHESPVRRGALLYNIFDSRAEGLATAMEEMVMHAGLYDDNPRAREIVWIMQAQRAARGLASLYAQANEFTMKDASDFHVAWTPRGWMSPTLDLLGFEQQLYLRQPGYGTSYVTGKHLIEELLADRMRQAREIEGGTDYSLADFFAELDAAGVIPTSLIRWEMTGEPGDAPGVH